MKLVDMKRPKDKEANKVCEAPSCEGPRYPYGLELRLEKDEMEKLGISADDYKIGGNVTVAAIGKITHLSKSASESNSGDKHENESMTIQITELALKNPAKFEDAFDEATKS